MPIDNKKAISTLTQLLALGSKNLTTKQKILAVLLLNSFKKDKNKDKEEK